MSLSLFAVLASNGLPSAVDSVRLSLEASSAWWFSIVNYSGYAVALGCAMETPETFIIIKRWWLARFRSDVREETTEDKKSWIVPLAAVGLIFIVVGIFVETYAEGKVSDIDALLRGHESDKISAAEQDAGTAQDSAKAAATNAGIAQTSADKAQASAAQADTDAGGAQRKAQAVGKETDLLTGQLSEAKRNCKAPKEPNSRNGGLSLIWRPVLPHGLFPTTASSTPQPRRRRGARLMLCAHSRRSRRSLMSSPEMRKRAGQQRILSGHCALLDGKE